MSEPDNEIFIQPANPDLMTEREKHQADTFVDVVSCFPQELLDQPPGEFQAILSRVEINGSPDFSEGESIEDYMLPPSEWAAPADELDENDESDETSPKTLPWPDRRPGWQSDSERECPYEAGWADDADEGTFDESTS